MRINVLRFIVQAVQILQQRIATAYWMNQRGYEVTAVEIGGDRKQG